MQTLQMIRSKAGVVGVVAALTLVVAGCGKTRGERALTGGAIGAGVGAVGAAVVDGSVGKGAIIGGVVGAGVGALSED